MISKIFEYAASEGMKLYKVPLYEKIYYGCLKGYSATLFTNPGGLVLSISTIFSNSEDEEALRQYLTSQDLKGQYNIERHRVTPAFVEFVWSFSNSVSDREFDAFVEWLSVALEKHHATGANICSECGGEISDGTGNGYMVHNVGKIKYIHKKCEGKLLRKTQQSDAFFKPKGMPSYTRGIVGGILGSVPAILLWAFVLRYGDVVVPTGLLIGLLAWFGYTINVGFGGKLKPLILCGVALVDVMLGTFLGKMLGSFRLFSKSATEPSVLIFVSTLMACFIICILCIVGTCYYSHRRRCGECGVTKLVYSRKSI